MEHDLTHFSLFTGIGGFDLAGERAGFRTVGQVEYADFPHAVLEKHWPGVPKWRDVRTVTADALRQAGIARPTLLSGGFPCQPVSHAGKRKGADDDRWLWPEMFRVVQELRPRWVCGENVTGLVKMGLDGVLGDLEGEGYTCRAFLIPAGAVGAPHKRERVFIVAHADGDGCEGGEHPERGQGAPGLRRRPADAGAAPRPGSGCGRCPGHGGAALADAEHARLADAEVAGSARARARAPAGAERAEQPARSGRGDRGAAAVADADGQGRGLGGEQDGDAGAGDGLEGDRGGGQGRQPARPLQPAAVQQGDGADRPEGARAGRTLADADVVLLCRVAQPRPHEARYRGPWPLPGQEARGEGIGTAPELAHPDLLDADRRGSAAGDVRGQLEAAAVVRGGERSLGDPALRLPRFGGEPGPGGLADPLVAGWEGWLSARAAAQRPGLLGQSRPGDPGGAPRWPAGPGQPQHAWEPPRTVESGVGGKSAKFSGRTHRLRALGNAVVPAQVFPILAAIAYCETHRLGLDA